MNIKRPAPAVGRFAGNNWGFFMVFKKALLVAAAALVSAGSANGAVTPTFTDGNGALAFNEMLFATFNAGDNGGVTGGYIVQSGSNIWGADPAVGGQGDPYLSVYEGQTASFDFSGFEGGGIVLLGFDYGSADVYNFFELLLSGGTSIIFNGQDIINVGIADGDQGLPRTNGRVTFVADAGTVITGLNLSSMQNSLETDNYGVVAAVPEPGTWAMLLLGFGAAGFSMRRGRNQKISQLQIA